MKAQKIAFAISALIAGPAAMAATLPGTGDSSVFLVVYNSNSSSTGETVIQALSTTVSGLPTSSTTYSGIDTSLSQLETDLGTSSAADLSFAVLAGNSLTKTLDFTTGTPSFLTTGTQVTNGVGNLNSWLGNTGISSTQNVAVEPSGTLTWQNAIATYLGTSGSSVNTVTAAGTPVEFYSAVSTTCGKTTCATKTDLAGTWSFSLANDSLTWSPTSSSPVPVPAALWLLMSGLAGVGGLSRRAASRSTDAVAA